MTVLTNSLFDIGVTDSPLYRICLETEEIASHVLLQCDEVAIHKAKHLGTPDDLRDVFGNVKKLGEFLEELES